MPGTNDGASAPNGTGAPAAEGTNTPAAQPPAAAAPPAPPAESTISMSSTALKARLDEERSKGAAKLLKELGYEKPEDLQTALKALKTREEADLTEKQRLEKRVKELEALEPQSKAYKTQLDALVEEQFKALPENWQEAIDAVANGSATERARMMQTFRAKGLLGAPAAPPAAPAAGAAPKGPANVAPPKTPPDPANESTKFSEWKAMEKRNPTLGSLFYQNNAAEIEATRPAGQ